MVPHEPTARPPTSARILVVEDSVTQAKHLRAILGSAGYAAETVGNAQAALDALRSAQFDLVMSDIIMPGMSGYEFCKVVKADPALRRIPVILLTTLNDANDIMVGLASGADNFITKPYEIADLLPRVASVLDDRRGGERQEAEEPPASLHFMGQAFTVTSPRQQILRFLLSTFEDYAGAKQREKDALRRAMESKRLAAESLALKNDELEAANARLAQVNDELAQAKQRIENSYDDLRKEQALREIELRRMEVELRTARAVQLMLIPERAPVDIPGFEFAFSYTSATETGGDWIGFTQDHARHRLSIFIGDVTGHGVGSALVTAGLFTYFSTLRHLCNSAVPTDLSLEELMSTLNGVSHDLGHEELYVTFFASRLDYQRRVLEFAGAGHPFPYLVRPSDLAGHDPSMQRQALHSLVSHGPRLGGRSSDLASFAVKTQALEAGDLIFWFTDGLTENRNPANAPIGERRLCRWLLEVHDQPVAAVKEHLERNIRNFLGDRLPEDDMAFVLAKAL